MRIAIDAMGGDYAPREIILGAIEALKLDEKIQILLVGNEGEIKKHLDNDHSRITIVHCEQVIEMDEHPAVVYRKKKDASIVVATRLVKEKKADAVVSAGSTGAQMVAALFELGRVTGIERPAICTVLPTLLGPKLLIDAGANTDCLPDNLLQFAKMGQLYAEKILGITKPQVGLVNIGEEESKGNELSIETYKLLQEDPEITFMGNIEGRDILAGKSDVMVCDGFVGNVILKVVEGTSTAILSLLKQELNKNWQSKLGALLLLPAFKRLKKQMDYSEHGGAPLLGVQGISIICHGSSKKDAIKNAIRVARDCIQQDFVAYLKEQVK